MGNKFNGRRRTTIYGMGEKFFLENWEVFEKTNLDKKDSLQYDQNLLVSQLKKDPFEDYTPIRLLGTGSFGKVLLVEHNITGMKRAMKQIKKSLIFQKSNESTVLNELNILKKIDHQNVVKVYEYYIGNVNYYIITEYCPGGDLLTAVNNKKELSEYQVSCIMYQILSAVNHLHKMNIMHRDLKLENILITKIEEDGLYRIKLCDFGTSHLFQEGRKEKKVIGSGYYMAPEVINKKYDFKCDLWSCGIIMYILLNKEIPFLGDNKTELKNNIKNKKYISEPLKKYSDFVKGLVDDLLEKNYNKRINAETALTYKIFSYYKCKKRINQMNFRIINNYIENIKKYKKSNIFQEIAIAYLIHNADLDEVSEAYKLFNKFDADGNGKIDIDELYNGLNEITEEKWDKKNVKEIFFNLDTNNNNYIEQEEFVKAAIDKKIFLSEKMLKFAFNFFDSDKKGLITINEISLIFKSNKDNNKNFSEEIKNIIKLVDKDGDGKISFKEFSQFMTSLLEQL